MIRINSKLAELKRFTNDLRILTEMAEKSKLVMSEFNELFKSKTLERLYTPECHYKGILPNTTYIIDKITDKKKLMFITRNNVRIREGGISETYTGRTFGLKKLGEKMFSTYPDECRIHFGIMESKHNDKYAGTQIRLTQVEVERAMQIGADKIPIESFPEALPFHVMMGCRPEETFKRVNSVKDVRDLIERIKTDNSVIKKEFFTPIIHKVDNQFYFDKNQTLANALLRQFKFYSQNGVQRNFSSIYPADSVKMVLKEKELEMWKQRALSQPIFL